MVKKDTKEVLVETLCWLYKLREMGRNVDPLIKVVERKLAESIEEG